MNDVRRWIQAMRQAVRIDKPTKILVSRGFAEMLAVHCAEVSVNCGQDAAPVDPTAPIMFRGIPVEVVQ